MDNPPEGMTSKDIRNMSEDELLDMDFFLNENDLFADEAGVTAWQAIAQRFCSIGICEEKVNEKANEGKK